MQNRLGKVESVFADLIWENEPIRSGQLVELCAQKLGWNKSTTYTVLRRLCERGIFQNQNSIVTSRISKEEFIANQTEEFVEDVFSGSIPAFLNAFTSKRELSQSEIDEIEQFIERYKNENTD